MDGIYEELEETNGAESLASISRTTKGMGEDGERLSTSASLES